MYSEWGCWAALVVGDVTLLHDEGIWGDFAWWTGFVLGVGLIFEDFKRAQTQAKYIKYQIIRPPHHTSPTSHGPRL